MNAGGEIWTPSSNHLIFMDFNLVFLCIKNAGEGFEDQ
jgi:hypothetical protein